MKLSFLVAGIVGLFAAVGVKADDDGGLSKALAQARNDVHASNDDNLNAFVESRELVSAPEIASVGVCVSTEGSDPDTQLPVDYRTAKTMYLVQVKKGRGMSDRRHFETLIPDSQKVTYSYSTKWEFFEHHEGGWDACEAARALYLARLAKPEKKP